MTADFWSVDVDVIVTPECDHAEICVIGGPGMIWEGRPGAFVRFGKPDDETFQRTRVGLDGLLARVADRARDHLAAEEVVHGCGGQREVYAEGGPAGRRRLARGVEPLAAEEIPKVSDVAERCKVSTYLGADSCNMILFTIPRNRTRTWRVWIDRWLAELS